MLFQPNKSVVFNNWISILGCLNSISFKSLINNNVKFYLGAALFHITKPKLTFMHDNEVRLNQKYAFNLGFSAYTNTYNRIVFYADHSRQGETGYPREDSFIYTTLIPMATMPVFLSQEVPLTG
jgi:hypothetical protein